MSKHVLVVDDDALMRRSLSLHLEQAGFRAGTAASAEDALAQARRDRPDIILLDIGLPGMDGLEALKCFQRELAGVPIVFVTARRRELDTILGLELGADDYITKPFNPDVLLAHIKAVLRRVADRTPIPAAPAPIAVGDLVIDPAAHTVTVSGRPYSEAMAARIDKVVETLLMERHKLVQALLSEARDRLDKLVDNLLSQETVDQAQLMVVLGPRPKGRAIARA